MSTLGLGAVPLPFIPRIFPASVLPSLIFDLLYHLQWLS